MMLIKSPLQHSIPAPLGHLGNIFHIYIHDKSKRLNHTIWLYSEVEFWESMSLKVSFLTSRFCQEKVAVSQKSSLIA